MKLKLLQQKYGEMEINTIIKLILMGISLIVLIVIISSIFTNNVSNGFDAFFDLFTF